MKIVIDIDEKDKRYINKVVDNSFLAKPTVDAILNAVRNGTPLRKGHGRLIDENQIPGDGSWDWSDRLDETPTIIEADTESED